VYVDDLIIMGARASDIATFKEEMAVRFKMSDLSALLLPRDRGKARGGCHQAWAKGNAHTR